MPDWLAVQRGKYLFFVILYDSINNMKHFELSESHLRRATAMSVVDCCQFGPNWMFGLKMGLMACDNLFGGTTDQICIFPDLI